MAAGDTKFEELTVAELRGLAGWFAVDLDGITKKVDIINELNTLGVTWKMYQDRLNAIKEAEEDAAIEEEFLEPAPAPVVVVPVPVEPAQPQPTVVKMTRRNFTYEVRGYRFTREAPYALVTPEDADYLIEIDGGFRMASPRELMEFYNAQ